MERNGSPMFLSTGMLSRGNYLTSCWSRPFPEYISVGSRGESLVTLHHFILRTVAPLKYK